MLVLSAYSEETVEVFQSQLGILVALNVLA